jgi:hypothetical protein
MVDGKPHDGSAISLPRTPLATCARWCVACQRGGKSNAVNLILRLFMHHFFTYNELVTSQVHPPQQHKQPTNTTSMVMETLSPPAAWV